MLGHHFSEDFAGRDFPFVFEDMDDIMQDGFISGDRPGHGIWRPGNQTIPAQVIGAGPGYRNAATGAKRRGDKPETGKTGSAERCIWRPGEQNAAGHAARRKNQIGQTLYKALQFHIPGSRTANSDKFTSTSILDTSGQSCSRL
jgi:hypothetical protein